MTIVNAGRFGIEDDQRVSEDYPLASTTPHGAEGHP